MLGIGLRLTENNGTGTALVTCGGSIAFHSRRHSRKLLRQFVVDFAERNCVLPIHLWRTFRRPRVVLSVVQGRLDILFLQRLKSRKSVLQRKMQVC